MLMYDPDPWSYTCVRISSPTWNEFDLLDWTPRLTGRMYRVLLGGLDARDALLMPRNMSYRDCDRFRLYLFPISSIVSNGMGCSVWCLIATCSYGTMYRRLLCCESSQVRICFLVSKDSGLNERLDCIIS